MSLSTGAILKPRSIVLVAALVVGTVWSWAFVRAALTRYPLYDVVSRSDAGLWRGAYHVHTRASPDSQGTLEQVTRAARAAGLQWVILTDHNIVDIPQPVYRDGVLLVFASESSTRAGHVVFLGGSRGLGLAERRAPQALEKARALGGAPIAAHPLNARRPYRDMSNAQLAGLEIVSLDDAFREMLSSPVDLLQLLAAYPANATHAVAGALRYPGGGLARWDDLLRTRRLAGFAALDAHGRPAYEVVMRVLSMYAAVGVPPTGDAAQDARALIEGLLAGRAFCGIDALANAGGFRFGSTDASGAVAPMGAEVSLARRPALCLSLESAGLPVRAQPRLICAGVAMPLQRAGDGWRFEYRPTAAGACRAEVWLEVNGSSRIWILSNPIYVR